MATATKTTGIKTYCPLCGEAGTLRMDPEDVTLMTCTECEGEINLDDLRERAEAMMKLAKWWSQVQQITAEA